MCSVLAAVSSFCLLTAEDGARTGAALSKPESYGHLTTRGGRGKVPLEFLIGRKGTWARRFPLGARLLFCCCSSPVKGVFKYFMNVDVRQGKSITAGTRILCAALCCVMGIILGHRTPSLSEGCILLRAGTQGEEDWVCQECIKGT